MKRMTKLSMICMTLGAVLMGCSSGGDTEPDTSTTETIQSQSSEVIQSEESSISSEVEELDFEESSESSSEFNYFTRLWKFDLSKNDSCKSI